MIDDAARIHLVRESFVLSNGFKFFSLFEERQSFKTTVFIDNEYTKRAR